MRIIVRAKVHEEITNEVEFEINASTGSEYEEFLALRAAGDTVGIMRLLKEGVEVEHTTDRGSAESDIDIWDLTYEEIEDDDQPAAEEGGPAADPDPAE